MMHLLSKYDFKAGEKMNCRARYKSFMFNKRIKLFVRRPIRFLQMHWVNFFTTACLKNLLDKKDFGLKFLNKQRSFLLRFEFTTFKSPWSS